MTTTLDAFADAPGTSAGCIATPSGDVGAEGPFEFCLGSMTPGQFAFFRPGDFAEITQTDTIAGPGKMIAFNARLRPGARPPPTGSSWQASAIVDGVAVWRRTLSAHGPAGWSTYFIDASGLFSGTHVLAFRLTFVAPALSPLLELEVPAFALAAISIGHASTVGPYFANESPCDGQGASGDPADPGAGIEFDVFGLGSTVDPSSIHLQIAGVDAVVAGVVQPDFFGAIGPAGETVHVNVTPTAPFMSAAHVAVAATATAGGVTNALTWSFQVADATPPYMHSIQALSPQQLRVVWTKAIALTDPTMSHDGTNPGLYSLQAIRLDNPTRRGILVPDSAEGYATHAPPLDPDMPCVRGSDDVADLPKVVSVAVIAQGVAGSSASIIDLFTEQELTPGARYFVTENGVEDLIGNSATSVTEVDSFVPPIPIGRVFDLMRLLPRINRMEDVTRDLSRFIRCLQEPTDLLLYRIDQWTDILDVDRTFEAMLDAMLADLGNPFPFVLSVSQKRQLVRLLVPIFKQKGTAPGIINAVRFFLGIVVTITSYTANTMQLGISELGGDEPPPDDDPFFAGGWILGPGGSFALYAFRVVATQALTIEQIAQVRFIANYMKPGHTHLVEIVTPEPPALYDPVELGISELGVDWLIHS